MTLGCSENRRLPLKSRRRSAHGDEIAAYSASVRFALLDNKANEGSTTHCFF